jgi:hypothetical protein
MKKFSTILTEAIFVGVLLIVLYSLFEYITESSNKYINLLVVGALFHIICEYTGLNVWYALEYCKLIKTN